MAVGSETELNRKIQSGVRRAIEDSGITNRRPARDWLSENKGIVLAALGALGLGPGQAVVQEFRHDRAQVDGTQEILEHYATIVETWRLRVESLEEDLDVCRMEGSSP